MKILVVVSTVFAISYGFILKLDEKIVHGKPVDIVDYPYQASVRNIYDNFVCGGVIIDEFTVLTAAHCTYSISHENLFVRVGSNIHNEGEAYFVSQVIEHEKYNPKTKNNDITILKLASPLSFSDTVQPVELQEEGVDVPAGTTAWVSGWGISENGYPNQLHAVDVNVVSNVECANIYGNKKITENMLCAHTFNHDACVGDSGGPLVAYGKLIGIVSWGRLCAKPGYPGVYAKISAIHSWIISNK